MKPSKIAAALMAGAMLGATACDKFDVIFWLIVLGFILYIMGAHKNIGIIPTDPVQSYLESNRRTGMFAKPTQVVYGAPFEMEFYRYHSDEFQPAIGERVKLWNQPGTDVVHVYARGSVGGDGNLGRGVEPEVARFVAESKSYRAIILSFDEKWLRLELILER